MTDEYIENTIRQVFADKFKVSLNDVKPETHIVNELGADSLDMVEAIIEIENRLNIIFTDDEELNTVVTPGQMVNYVLKVKNR